MEVQLFGVVVAYWKDWMLHATERLEQFDGEYQSPHVDRISFWIEETTFTWS
jgi:hypothetical protein